MLLRVLDGREAPLEQLIGNESAQLALASQVTLYLGCQREDRLYVREAKRITIPMSYSTGDVDEPATEVG